MSNTGDRDGQEVVQVYIKRLDDTDGPIKSLRGYSKVNLKAGEKKTVSIPLPRESFENWDEKTGTMRVVPGQYRVYVGSSSADIDLQTLDVKI